MNLVKNGAVLLAALSVFAMTSCNKGDTKKEVDYDAALAWVKEHYKATEEKKMVKADVSWDYRKNVVKEKLPDKLPTGYEDLQGLDGNGLSKFALESEFAISDASAKSGKTELKHDDVEGVDVEFFDYPLNEETFKKEFEKDDGYKFYVVNNKTLRMSLSKNRSFKDMLKYTQTSEAFYDEEGRGQKIITTLHNDEATINIPGAKTVNLGKMHIVVTIAKLS